MTHDARGSGIRLVRLYRGIALILLNTVILFLTVNLALCAYYWWRDAKSLGDPHMYSKYFQRETYTRVPPDVVATVHGEFDHMGDEQSFQYHPWAGFVESGFEGKFLNVSPDGIRKTVSVPAPPDVHQDLVVWMFGGSTTFGYGMPDSETIPSHFQAELQRLTADKRVIVVNEGHASYGSTQELSLLLAELRRNTPPPSVVTVLNGLNDAYHDANGDVFPGFSAIFTARWASEKMRRESSRELTWRARLDWFDLTDEFPMLRFARTVRGSHLVRDRSETVFTGPVARRLLPGKQPVKLAVRNYLLNRVLVDRAARAVGARAVQFLQPVPGVGTYRAQLRSVGPRELEFYHQVLASDRLGHDIHDVVLDLEHPYVDGEHYSDAGCLAVAQRMAQVVAAELAQPPAEN